MTARRRRQALRVGRLRRRGKAGTQWTGSVVAAVAGDVTDVLRGLLRGARGLVWHTVRARTACAGWLYRPVQPVPVQPVPVQPVPV